MERCRRFLVKNFSFEEFFFGVTHRSFSRLQSLLLIPETNQNEQFAGAIGSAASLLTLTLSLSVLGLLKLDLACGLNELVRRHDAAVSFIATREQRALLGVS